MGSVPLKNIDGIRKPPLSALRWLAALLFMREFKFRIAMNIVNPSLK